MNTAFNDQPAIEDVIGAEILRLWDARKNDEINQFEYEAGMIGLGFTFDQVQYFNPDMDTVEA